MQRVWRGFRHIHAQRHFLIFPRRSLQVVLPGLGERRSCYFIQGGAQKNPNFAVINETQLKWVLGFFLRAGFWVFFYAPTRRGALPPPSFLLGTRPHQKWGFFCAPVFGFFFCAPPPPIRNWVFFCAPPCRCRPPQVGSQGKPHVGRAARTLPLEPMRSKGRSPE